MTPPKREIAPKRAMSQKIEPDDRFFDQYVWHHKVHENLQERLRYFLLKVRPYDGKSLGISLERLVKDKNIGGLRAYRVFGRDDLMVRAWMDSKTFDEMTGFFYEYIEGAKTTLVAVKADYIQQVEYRWYWKETPPTDKALRKDAELMIDLMVDQSIVARIESGEDADRELFNRYRQGGLVINKPSAAGTITFFICVMFHNNAVSLNDKERLVTAIKAEISGRGSFLYPEIDFTSGVICDLMIRASTSNYFAIGELIEWLSLQPHVVETEIYLSRTERPLCGETNLSQASFDARDEPNPMVYQIFPDPFHPSGPYPTRKWGKTAEEVVAYLREKRLSNPPRGLRRFLHDYLLAVLRDEPGFSALQIFPELERYLREHYKEYIVQLGLKVDEVYKAAGIASPKSSSLGDLFRIYFAAAKMASRPVNYSGKWDSFLDVRNRPFHGVNHYWKDGADVMIEYWPTVQSLLKEIESVCKSADRRAPEIITE